MPRPHPVRPARRSSARTAGTSPRRPPAPRTKKERGRGAGSRHRPPPRRAHGKRRAPALPVRPSPTGEQQTVQRVYHLIHSHAFSAQDICEGNAIKCSDDLRQNTAGRYDDRPFDVRLRLHMYPASAQKSAKRKTQFSPTEIPENFFIENLYSSFVPLPASVIKNTPAPSLCRCRTPLLCLPLHLYAVAAPRPFGKTFYRKRSSAFFQNTGFRENKPKKRKFSNNFSIFSKKGLKRNALVL